MESPLARLEVTPPEPAVGYRHRGQLFLAFLRIGLTSFGASASQAIVAELVERRKWLSDLEFEEIFSLSSLSPGPFHLNVVIHFGLRFGGAAGMLIAMTAFVGPSLLMCILIVTSIDMATIASWLQTNRGVVPGVFAGIAGLLISVIAKLGRSQIKTCTPLSLSSRCRQD